MTDYTNPKVMKEVVKEAKDAGIFRVGRNKRSTTNTYILKLDEDNAMTLEMINREKSYDYKLVQINFEMGLTELIKPIKIFIKKQKERMFNKNNYEVKVTQIKDDASRAWDRVSGKVLTLYFQSKEGYIKQINTRGGKR